MSNLTPIEWTDKSLNPGRGCSRVSPGCGNCYFHREEKRLRHNPNGAYANGTAVTFHPHVLEQLERDLDPSRYFIGSMTDWLHVDYSDEVVFTLFETLCRVNWDWYFLLTKRSERLALLGPHLPWPDHVIAVVSVENEDYLYRIDHLRPCGSKHIGVSFEPQIGRIPLATEEARRRWIRGLDFVIVGGETDPKAPHRMRGEWVREIRDACHEEGVPFHFKQWGDIDEHGENVGHKKAGRLLDGRTHDDLPLGCAEHLVRAQLLAAAEKQRRTRSR